MRPACEPVLQEFLPQCAFRGTMFLSCHDGPFAAQCSFCGTMGLSRHNVPFAAQWAFRGTMFLLRHNAPFSPYLPAPSCRSTMTAHPVRANGKFGSTLACTIWRSTGMLGSPIGSKASKKRVYSALQQLEWGCGFAKVLQVLPQGIPRKSVCSFTAIDRHSMQATVDWQSVEC